MGEACSGYVHGAAPRAALRPTVVDRRVEDQRGLGVVDDGPPLAGEEPRLLPRAVDGDARDGAVVAVGRVEAAVQISRGAVHDVVPLVQLLARPERRGAGALVGRSGAPPARAGAGRFVHRDVQGRAAQRGGSSAVDCVVAELRGVVAQRQVLGRDAPHGGARGVGAGVLRHGQRLAAREGQRGPVLKRRRVGVALRRLHTENAVRKHRHAELRGPAAASEHDGARQGAGGGGSLELQQQRQCGQQQLAHLQGVARARAAAARQRG